MTIEPGSHPKPTQIADAAAFLFEQLNRSAIAVDLDQLTVFDALGTVACSHNGGYSILASNDRAMTQNTANIGDQSLRMSKELRPGCLLYTSPSPRD